jgi:hypothetical protein
MMIKGAFQIVVFCVDSVTSVRHSVRKESLVEKMTVLIWYAVGIRHDDKIGCIPTACLIS